METLAQKNARLRALREARDGTPEQISARNTATRKNAQEHVNRATAIVFDNLRSVLNNNPDELFTDHNLNAVLKSFDMIDRAQDRVNRMPKR